MLFGVCYRESAPPPSQLSSFVEGRDPISRGGSLNLVPPWGAGEPEDWQEVEGHLFWSVSRPELVMNSHRTFDLHVPEGNGWLVVPQNPYEGQPSCWVTWSVSTQRTQWHIPFLTLAEYLQRGSERGWAWYWPLNSEVRTLLPSS